MDEIIKQITEKFGVDETKAGEIAGHLQDGGHDLPSLLQGGNFADVTKNLMGDKFQDLLGGVPGIGGMLGSMFGGDAEAGDTEVVETREESMAPEVVI